MTVRLSLALAALFVLVVLSSVACRDAPRLAGVGEPQSAPPHWAVNPGPSLPEPLANNAVAALSVDGREWLFSFLGLGAGKDFQAITTHAYALVVKDDVKDSAWERLPDVPGPVGRIAATAQGFGERVYLFGGYSVAKDAKETTSPAVDIYSVRERRYTRGAAIPLPVDDSASGVWRDRLIFLISGWSVANNVDVVQIYDPAKDTWSQASKIPGHPVFGHAGGIVRDAIIYCGGARVQAPKTPKYVINEECFRGDIDPQDPTRVAWRTIATHPGAARYRAAAGPVKRGGIVGVMFVGGTANPYNYNGVGYDGNPSEPESTSWIYDIEKNSWVEGPHVTAPSMDHRGLVAAGGGWWTIGGFGPGQVVSASVYRLLRQVP